MKSVLTQPDNTTMVVRPHDRRWTAGPPIYFVSINSNATRREFYSDGDQVDEEYSYPCNQATAFGNNLFETIKKAINRYYDTCTDD